MKWVLQRAHSSACLVIGGPQIQASMCIISKAKRIYITKMVISVSMVTYNKIRSRNNSLSVRARAYSNIMVNPLVIKGDTRHTIVYNISIINCSIKRSIYYLKRIASFFMCDLIQPSFITSKWDNNIEKIWNHVKQPWRLEAKGSST